MSDIENLQYYIWYNEIYPQIRQDKDLDITATLASVEREVERLQTKEGDLDQTLSLVRGFLYAMWRDGYMQGFGFYKACAISDLYNQPFPEMPKNPLPKEYYVDE